MRYVPTSHLLIVASLVIGAACAANGCSVPDPNVLGGEDPVNPRSNDPIPGEGGGSSGGTSEPQPTELPAPTGQHDNAPTVPPNGAPAPTKDIEDPIEAAKLPKGQAQLSIVCGRNIQNAVTRALCNNPSITGLADLQAKVGLAFQRKDRNGDNGGDGNPRFMLQGNSSSLVARFVSAVNPRAIVFDRIGNNNTEGYVVLGFTRGDQFVELAAYDETQDKLTFYLVKFEQECNKTHNCLPADLVTPAIETKWTSWSLYQDEDVKNTTFDCRHCHQPAGPNTPFLMRFQELRDPWTHTLADNRSGGRALLEDFHRVHGQNEDYGPVPAALIDKSDGRKLEDFVRGAGFGRQPNEFESMRIESQVRDSSRGQPEVNDPPGKSSEWQSIFDAAFRGDFIPVPYHDVKVTSEPLVASAATAYKGYMAGTVTRDKFPDIRAVFLTKAMEDTSIMARPGLDGAGVLKQMCQQCHNPKLDQSLTRAKFDVTKLATMSKEEKNEAIARLKLPRTNAKKMPPVMFKDMRQSELDLAIKELSK